MKLKLVVDEELFDRLLDAARRERRDVPAQAEVELRRAMHLPFPVPPPARGEKKEDQRVQVS